MSEYIRRYEGGFYIVDDDRPRSKVLAVRRAVHQVINPETGHPFPELTLEDQYTRSLLDPPVRCSYSNTLPTYGSRKPNVSSARGRGCSIDS